MVNKKTFVFGSEVTLKEAQNKIGNTNVISRILINWNTGSTIWEVE